jgi:hypothetical protein
MSEIFTSIFDFLKSIFGIFRLPSLEDVVIAALIPYMLIFLLGGPYTPRYLITFLLAITVYNQAVNFYLCNKKSESYDFKRSLLAPLPWYAWAVAIFVIFNFFSLSPIIMIGGNLAASVIGIIIVGMTLYLPMLRVNNKCTKK